MRRDFLRLNLALYCFATAHSCGLRRYSRGNAAILVALPQRIRAGCDETLSEYAPEHELCHSAFVRVATPAAAGRTAPEDFATAHSCGLRLTSLTPQQFADCFATAHSCGLRPHQKNPLSPDHPLCHSAFVRVATMNSSKHILLTFALPQRIRAGCDLASSTRRRPKMLCHSAFVRVATAEKQCSALRICCEKVDSFSSVGESGLALTIFPFSFAAKATYVAINDSFGRAIDRFFWCEPHRN